MGNPAAGTEHKPCPCTVSFLFVYCAGLGLGLLYLVFAVWPPDFDYAKSLLGEESDLKLKDISSDIVFFGSGKSEVQAETNRKRATGPASTPSLLVARAKPLPAVANGPPPVEQTSSPVHRTKPPTQPTAPDDRVPSPSDLPTNDPSIPQPNSGKKKAAQLNAGRSNQRGAKAPTPTASTPSPPVANLSPPGEQTSSLTDRTKEPAYPTAPDAEVLTPPSSLASSDPIRQSSASTTDSTALDNEIRLHVTYDERLLLTVILLGALGSYIHATTSFTDFVGNRQFVRSWLPWYLLRPLVGAPTALLLYFVVRAGFLTATASGGDVNRYGIAAIAGLGGMFSLKAADKLKELFDTLFKTEEKRKDPLKEQPIPTITGFEPAELTRGAPHLKILGTGFAKESTVTINRRAKTEQSVEVVSATELTVKLVADDTRAGVAHLEVEVYNPPPGGGKARKSVVVN